ncbi:MAG: LapA family protein [Gammaproteobacteria bacterium]|nr:LapA family protein [Gammaproteobacteria bacterium]
MAALRSLLFLLLALLVLLLGVLVGIDNSEPVSLVFLDWTSPAAPVFVWVCLAIMIGFLLGIALTGMATLRQRRGRRLAERDLDATRRELEARRPPGSH